MRALERCSLFGFLFLTLGLVQGARAQTCNPADYTHAGSKNVVMIVLDDVGLERLSWWPTPLFPNSTATLDPAPPPTPNLECLANRGTVFTNVWSNPLCGPARAALLSGRHCHRTGFLANPGSLPSGANSLSPSEFTIPELLNNWSQGAYRTGAFGKWHLANPRDPDAWRSPLDSGFDTFLGTLGNVGEGFLDDFGNHHYRFTKTCSYSFGPSQQQCQGSPQLIGLCNLCPLGDTNCFCDLPPCSHPYPRCVDPETPPYKSEDWSGLHTAKDAMEWIDRLDPTEDRFFAYVSFNAPHAPWQAPPSCLYTYTPPTGNPDPDLHPEGMNDPIQGKDYFGAENQHRRHAQVFHWMLESVDTLIGVLVCLLDELGILDETVIVVIGDNGTSAKNLEPNLPYYDLHGKNTPYNLGVRVPLIIADGSALSGMSCSPLPDACSIPADLHNVPDPATCPGPIDDNHELISIVDLWATVGRLAGMSSACLDAEKAAWESSTMDIIDSVSFLDPHGNYVSGRDYALVERCRPDGINSRRAITDGQYKLILQDERFVDLCGVKNREVEFFDLSQNEEERGGAGWNLLHGPSGPICSHPNFPLILHDCSPGAPGRGLDFDSQGSCHYPQPPAQGQPPEDFTCPPSFPANEEMTLNALYDQLTAWLGGAR